MGYNSSLEETEARYSEPMPWVGMYIAVASFYCSLAMWVDLVHGFNFSEPPRFPCRYFTLNAPRLFAIGVAMKLLMDLNSPMPGYVDQASKLAGMPFLIIMLANLLPSLAIMDSKQLVTNIIGVVILVIYLVVNVCIQLKTGVIGGGDSEEQYHIRVVAIIYASMLLVLLMIYISTALAVARFKQILESKYEACHEKALIELHQAGGLLTVEKLKRHVTNHWIMAETGSFQLFISCSATAIASGLIGYFCYLLSFSINNKAQHNEYGSDYKWSMFYILDIQDSGMINGLLAAYFRCWLTFNKQSVKWMWNHINVFRVESYWTHKLCEWKDSSIPFSFGTSRKSKIIFEFLKILSLNSCIGFQTAVVIACKMIRLIPMFLLIGILLCIRCVMKWLMAMLSDSGTVLGSTAGQHDSYRNLSRYVVQLQDDMEVLTGILKCHSDNASNLILKWEKRQPKNLMTLIIESSSFEGVGKYDSHHVPPLFGDEYLDCWSLPLVTLTTILVSLPNIQSNTVDRLLSSVSEGLDIVRYVEETLNATNEYKSIQKAAKRLWLEVEVNHKWLGKKIKNPDPQLNIVHKILKWFNDTAKKIVTEVNEMDIGSRNDKDIYMSICANSMYRITQTILFSYNTDIEDVSQEELFTNLKSMIADILAACLTNLPQVIVMKCHETKMEKREASVRSTAILLGMTTSIINTLQDRQLPSLDPDELPFIDKWRATLTHPSP